MRRTELRMTRINLAGLINNLDWVCTDKIQLRIIQLSIYMEEQSDLSDRFPDQAIEL